MQIIQIISEHKYIRKNRPLKPGYRRVEAVVNEDGYVHTVHIDIPKE